MDTERYRGLIYPRWFESLSQDAINEISNGCGPKGWGWAILDKFRSIGYDMSPSCDIHDVDYHFGTPKKTADNRFMDNNMILARRCFFLFRPIAEHIGFLYYLAVKNCGDLAYQNSGESYAESVQESQDQQTEAIGSAA